MHNSSPSRSQIFTVVQDREIMIRFLYLHMKGTESSTPVSVVSCKTSRSKTEVNLFGLTCNALKLGALRLGVRPRLPAYLGKNSAKDKKHQENSC